MIVEKTPAEQAEFDRTRIYFEFEARREYLREQTTQINVLLKLGKECLVLGTGDKKKIINLKTQQAELKQQWLALEKEAALVEIERLKALLATADKLGNNHHERCR